MTMPVPEIEPESVVVPPRQTEALPTPRITYRRRNDLLVAGVGTTLSVWAADRLLANNLSLNWQPWLPVIGPWFLLSEVLQQPDPSRATTTLLVLDGLAQAGGLIVAVLGGVLRERRTTISLPRLRPGSMGAPVTLGFGLAGRPGLALTF